MNRRDFLVTGSAATAGLVLEGASLTPTGRTTAAGLTLEGALLNPTGRTKPAAIVRGDLAEAQQFYRDAKYGQLADVLPALVDHAHGLGDEAVKCQAFVLSAEHYLKIGNERLAAYAAACAREAASKTGDPLCKANADWMTCVILRHAGQSRTGYELTERAAGELARAGLRDSITLATYGHLFLTSAYTAAKAGNSAAAHAYYAEAVDVSTRFDHEQVHGLWYFGPKQTAQYGISVANYLQDVGGALAHAQSVKPAALASVERRERYWIDLAKTFITDGDHKRAAVALRSACLVSPQSAARPKVRRMAQTAGISLSSA